jgi:hypothetical protein
MTVVKNRLAALSVSFYEAVASEGAGELAVVTMWSLSGLCLSARVFFG